MVNERLRVAMSAAGVDIEGLARAVDVNPKTVQRWVAGRIPHPRHRWAVVEHVHESEGFLWPEAQQGQAASDSAAEILAAYPHRSQVDAGRWWRLIHSASAQIDLLGYTLYFLPQQHPHLVSTLIDKCQRGARVRLVVADPASQHVRDRDEEEQEPITLVARIRSSLRAFAPLLNCPGAELRFQDVPLYNSLFRFDDEMFRRRCCTRPPAMQHRFCTFVGCGRTACSLGSRVTSTRCGQSAGQPARGMSRFTSAHANGQNDRVGRRDYYNDPNAPAANSLVPAASAVVVDEEGRILLHRRRDNDVWALPGGKMELGESVADCAIRETKEETGFDVEITGIVGIYSDPKHVFSYDDGEVRQEFSICLAARVSAGEVAVSEESHEVAFFKADEVAGLPMVDSIRLRVDDFLSRDTPAIR